MTQISGADLLAQLDEEQFQKLKGLLAKGALPIDPASPTQEQPSAKSEQPTDATPSPLALYVLARLSLVLPATAIGQRPTLKGSWRLSRSNGWRLAVLSPAVLAWVLYVLLLNESLVPPGIALHGLAAFTVVLLWVFGMALLSRAYSWFAGEIEPPTPS